MKSNTRATLNTTLTNELKLPTFFACESKTLDNMTPCRIKSLLEF